MRPKHPDSKVRRNLSKRWYNLMSRCYNPDCHAYSNYGAKGVVVSEDWLDKERFISDAKSLPGYDEKLLLGGKLHLDKDMSDGENIYSSKTCSFVSLESNNKVKPNQQVCFKATDRHGNTYRSCNQSEFARTHGLRQGSVSACIRGKLKTTGGFIIEKEG